MINQITRISLLVIIVGLLAVNQPAWAGDYCADGTYRFDCSNHGGIGYLCADNTVQPDCTGHGGYLCNNLGAVTQPNYCYSVGVYAPTCGNGRIDTVIGETCDNGTANSNTAPNGCRTGCQKAACGDGVADANDECDGNDFKGSNECFDYDAQGNLTYNIREYYWGGTLDCDINDCTKDFSDCEKCGDGVFQTLYEQCDDGNSINDDGCNNDCTSCVQLTGNIDITTDTELCSNVFNVTDYGDEGVIIVKHPDITLDCDGATLVGPGVTPGIESVGIYIKMSNNVTIKNCTVTGYAVGIKMAGSQNVNFTGQGNNIYGNTQKLVLENSQLTPPKPMKKTETGSLVGGNRPIKNLLQGQTQKKFQAGAKPMGFAKPDERSRLKLPARPAMSGQPGTLLPPRGIQPAGGKIGRGLSPKPPTPSGTKSMPPDPLDIKSMPPDPLETKKMPPFPLGKSSMPVDSLDSKSMQVDPYDSKKIPAETPAIKQPIPIVR